MTHLQSADIEKLKINFSGEILLPGVKGYEDSRQIWNGMFDRRPSIIAQCKNTNDVIKAVNFARENNLLNAVKGGGHNSAGNAVCDDGMGAGFPSFNGAVCSWSLCKFPQ